MRGVNISLGMAAIQPCAAFDLNGDERVTVDELEVKGNNDALSGFRDSRDPQPVARPRLRSHPDWQALGPQRGSGGDVRHLFRHHILAEADARWLVACVRLRDDGGCAY